MKEDYFPVFRASSVYKDMLKLVVQHQQVKNSLVRNKMMAQV
jgi:hypothetical protein